MMITETQIRAAALHPIGPEATGNMKSVLVALDRFGARFGLDQAHRLVQLFAQLLEESGEFRYDREIWGPTPAQKRYDTRTDLGNTAARDGDGKLRAGRGPIEVTGGTNEKRLTAWCRQYIDPKAPDFYAHPELIDTDPWEGLSAIWFWTDKNLNKWADQGDVETISRRVNGGLNGLDVRLHYYQRLGLVVLGYRPEDVRGFQSAHELAADGECGPKTRAAIHLDLAKLTPKEKHSPNVQAAPVTVPTPMARPAKDTAVSAGLATLFAAGILGAWHYLGGIFG